MIKAANVLLATAVAATVMSLTTGAAYATTTSTTTVPCTTRSTSEYFSKWGDTNQYFLAPGASFVSGAADPWATSGGASTVVGGDPWDVTAAAHPGAVNIPPGGMVKSMSFCVASNESSIRFFYRSPGVNGAALFLNVTVTSGVNVANNTIDIGSNTAGWAVANVLDLPTIYGVNGQEDITIAFSPANTPATWQVDNVMVDPFTPL